MRTQVYRALEMQRIPGQLSNLLDLGARHWTTESELVDAIFTGECVIRSVEVWGVR